MSLIVKSTRERVVKMIIATVLCLGFAAYCQYDAWYKYTREEQTGDRLFNQYAVPVLIVLGLVALFFAVKAVRFRIEADEEAGISLNGQEPISWSSITDIDTSILAKKGFLFVKYRDSQDSQVTLKLDAFNLDYFDELYAMIRTKLGLPAESPDKSQPPSA